MHHTTSDVTRFSVAFIHFPAFEGSWEHVCVPSQLESSYSFETHLALKVVEVLFLVEDSVAVLGVTK